LNRYERKLVCSSRAVAGNRCAVLSGTVAFSQYTIQHRRTFNLNATFAGGEAIGDVAFDGTNLYVSSWHSGSGVQTVGAGGCFRRFAGHTQRRADTCGMDTYDAAGASRDTLLITATTSTGVRDTTDTGIRRVDTSGTIDGSWSGDGVLLPGEIDPSATRFDTLDVDPSCAWNIRQLQYPSQRPCNGFAATGLSEICPQTVSTRAISPSHRMEISMCATTPPAAQALQESTGGIPMAASEVQPQLWDGQGALQQAFVAYIPVNEMFYSGFSSLVLYNQRVSGQNKCSFMLAMVHR
jgi:hypothetical protein